MSAELRGDIGEGSHAATDFIFECMDDDDPSAVVVGPWRTPKISGRSLESWRIGLNDLVFVQMSRSLRYVPQILVGDADGSDLVGLGKGTEREDQVPTKNRSDVLQS